jgi:hypothetical protein
MINENIRQFLTLFISIKELNKIQFIRVNIFVVWIQDEMYNVLWIQGHNDNKHNDGETAYEAETAVGLPGFLAGYFTTISVSQNTYNRIVGLLMNDDLERILGSHSGGYEEFYILVYVCYLLQTGFLFGLFFGTKVGGDMSSETSVGFHRTTPRNVPEDRTLR